MREVNCTERGLRWFEAQLRQFQLDPEELRLLNDRLGLPATTYYGGCVLVDHDALGPAQLIEARVFELQPKLLGNDLSACQNGAMEKVVFQS